MNSNINSLLTDITDTTYDDYLPKYFETIYSPIKGSRLDIALLIRKNGSLNFGPKSELHGSLLYVYPYHFNDSGLLSKYLSGITNYDRIYVRLNVPIKDSSFNMDVCFIPSNKLDQYGDKVRRFASSYKLVIFDIPAWTASYLSQNIIGGLLSYVVTYPEHGNNNIIRKEAIEEFVKEVKLPSSQKRLKSANILGNYLSAWSYLGKTKIKSNELAQLDEYDVLNIFFPTNDNETIPLYRIVLEDVPILQDFVVYFNTAIPSAFTYVIEMMGLDMNGYVINNDLYSTFYDERKIIRQRIRRSLTLLSHPLLDKYLIILKALTEL